MRIIFFAGKGGVGKTSAAAATGIKSAERGNKTVIMSLDVAHSLSDIFDMEQTLINQSKGEPVQVGENLWIQELDIQEEIEKNWGDIHKYLSALLNTSGLDEILAEELAILPGMEEVSLLLHINRYARNNDFDVVLLDCAPTGESLRFISIPTTLEWYINKIFKLEKTIVKYARPVAKRFYDLPLPGEDYFDAIERLFEKLRGVDTLLTNPEITTVRLVTNPEKIVLKETQRAFMYFSLYKMSIDAIIMNRVLPDRVKEPYFQNWRENQKRYVREAEDYFQPVPLLPVNLFQGEVLGFDHLKILGDQLYGARNPLDRFFDGKPYEFSKVNGKYQLKMKLPFIEKRDVALHKIEDELIVRIGGFKRRVMLPRQVAALDSLKATLEGPYLWIHFDSSSGDDHGRKKNRSLS